MKTVRTLTQSWALCVQFSWGTEQVETGSQSQLSLGACWMVGCPRESSQVAVAFGTLSRLHGQHLFPLFSLLLLCLLRQLHPPGHRGIPWRPWLFAFSQDACHKDHVWLWSFQERSLWGSTWKVDHSVTPVLAASQGTHLDLSLLLRWCGRRRNCGFLLSNSRKKGCESMIGF